MKLDFKGIITKDALEKDISSLDDIIKENEYAIIVENGIGKYVVFDINFVENYLTVKESQASHWTKTDSLTLVESMIKALEDIPNKKATAIELSSLVEIHYGRKASPVVIRTRAEENANDKGAINLFYLEPGNVIGLKTGVTLEDYLSDKYRTNLIKKIERLFINHDKVDVSTVISYCRAILKGPMFENFTDEKYINYILNIGRYRIENNLLLKGRIKHV
ncbi:MAG: hypothetical protein AB7U52_05510 [Candidatus Izemoplasmatales bacterium]